MYIHFLHFDKETGVVNSIFTINESMEKYEVNEELVLKQENGDFITEKVQKPQTRNLQEVDYTQHIFYKDSDTCLIEISEADGYNLIANNYKISFISTFSMGRATSYEVIAEKKPSVVTNEISPQMRQLKEENDELKSRLDNIEAMILRANLKE